MSLNDNPNADLEKRLQEAARTFHYPPTPDVTSAIRSRLNPQRRNIVSFRRLAVRVAIIVLVLLLGLLAVPEVRASVLEFIRLGAVRIFIGEPTITATAIATPLPDAPNTRDVPVLPLAKLQGETSLEMANRQARFPVRVPTLLGSPDRVFYQVFGGPVVILIWTDPADPDHAKFSLHQLGVGAHADKFQPRIVERTKVKGLDALWVEGPHFLAYQTPRGTDVSTWFLVAGNVLVWKEGNITYRLETSGTMEEAIRIAESLDEAPQSP